MTAWLGGPMIECPFGLCSATITLVIEQARPDNDEETVQRIPIHEIAGLSGYRGGCPASLMGMPLEGAAEELLHDEELRIARIVTGNPPPPGSTRTPTPEHSKTPHPDEHRTEWFGRGSNAGGAPRENRGPAARGYRPIPFDHLGSTPVSDSMRDQLRALTSLAIEGFGQASELCAVVTNAIDEAIAATAGLEEKRESTHTIAVAAIGGGDPPAAAANMVGSSNAAGSTIDDLRSGLELAKVRVEAVYGSCTSAAESGAEYLNVI